MVKNRTNIWPNNLTVRHISKGNEISMWKRLMYSYVYCCTIYSSQNVETSKVSIDRECVVDRGILPDHLQNPCHLKGHRITLGMLC